MSPALVLLTALPLGQLQRDPFQTLALATTPFDPAVTATCPFHVTAIVEDGEEAVALGVVPSSGQECTPQVLRVGDTVTPHHGRIVRIDDQGIEVVTEYLTIDGDLVTERTLLGLGQEVDW